MLRVHEDTGRGRPNRRHQKDRRADADRPRGRRPTRTDRRDRAAIFQDNPKCEATHLRGCAAWTSFDAQGSAQCGSPDVCTLHSATGKLGVLNWDANGGFSRRASPRTIDARDRYSPTLPLAVERRFRRSALRPLGTAAHQSSRNCRAEAIAAVDGYCRFSLDEFCGKVSERRCRARHAFRSNGGVRHSGAPARIRARRRFALRGRIIAQARSS